MKEDILKLVQDIEEIRDSHRLEAALITSELNWQLVIKNMHESKAAAYDFVVRKFRRKFNLTNHEKETNT